SSPTTGRPPSSASRTSCVTRTAPGTVAVLLPLVGELLGEERIDFFALTRRVVPYLQDLDTLTGPVVETLRRAFGDLDFVSVLETQHDLGILLVVILLAE